MSDETLNTYQDTFSAVTNTKEDEKAKYQCVASQQHEKIQIKWIAEIITSYKSLSNSVAMLQWFVQHLHH